MAEDGYDFGSPEFDRDDYDGDIDDKLPMVPDDDTQRIASNQSCHIIILGGNSESLLLKVRNKGL